MQQPVIVQECEINPLFYWMDEATMDCVACRGSRRVPSVQQRDAYILQPYYRYRYQRAVKVLPVLIPVPILYSMLPVVCILSKHPSHSQSASMAFITMLLNVASAICMAVEHLGILVEGAWNDLDNRCIWTNGQRI